MKKAAELGSSQAHCELGNIYYNQGGHLKKAKFHYEAAAMAGHDSARSNLGRMEGNSGNVEQAIKHWIIGASAGCYRSMKNLIFVFKKGLVSRESINTTLTAYNKSCVEVRSESRDAVIRTYGISIATV
jgi:TPR repeat protein